jgi:hypothetical protein
VQDQVPAGGPRLGGVHQQGRDAAPFQPSRDRKTSGVAVDLAGEMRPLANGLFGAP